MPSDNICPIRQTGIRTDGHSNQSVEVASQKKCGFFLGFSRCLQAFKKTGDNKNKSSTEQEERKIAKAKVSRNHAYAQKNVHIECPIFLARLTRRTADGAMIMRYPVHYF